MSSARQSVLASVDTRSGRYYAREMTEAAPAEQAVEAETKKRLFHRIPTSLLVTLVGIALTAWLLPAFTKQWDDRQKARELQVSLVSQMSGATARALTEAHDIMVRTSDREAGQAKGGVTSALTAASWEPTPAPEKEWARSSIRIEAQLRSHLGDEPANGWRAYRHVVDRLLAYAAGHQFGPQADPYPAPLGDDLGKLNDSARQFYRDRLDVVGMLRHSTPGDEDTDLLVGVATELATVQDQALRYEEVLAHQVLNSHVAGYSTSSHDLIQNLIP